MARRDGMADGVTPHWSGGVSPPLESTAVEHPIPHRSGCLSLRHPDVKGILLIPCDIQQIQGGPQIKGIHPLASLNLLEFGIIEIPARSTFSLFRPT